MMVILVAGGKREFEICTRLHGRDIMILLQ